MASDSVNRRSIIIDADTDASDGARHARTELRTEQILRAAARLMERQGSHAVSMQAVASEAGVSVGLIYRYFSGKEDLLLGVIVNVLEQYSRRVPVAAAAAGDDPVERLAAGYRAYCEVVDGNRHAAVLTYRESKTLGDAGIATIKSLEVDSIGPLETELAAGVAAGVLTDHDPSLAAYDLLVLAHAWALKHWYFAERLEFDAYVRHQFGAVMTGLIVPRRRRSYRHLLTATP